MKKYTFLLLIVTPYLHAMENYQLPSFDPHSMIVIQMPYGYQPAPFYPEPPIAQVELVDPQQAQSTDDLLEFIQKTDAAIEKSSTVKGNATRILEWKKEYQQLFDALPQEYENLNQLIQASSSIELQHPIVSFLLHKKISKPRKKEPETPPKEKKSFFKKQKAENKEPNPALTLTRAVSEEQLDSLASKAAEQFGLILPHGQLPLLAWENKKVPKEERSHAQDTFAGRKIIMDVIKYFKIPKVTAISSLPYLPGIEAITFLDFSDLELNNLPDSIGQLTSLEGLRLTNNKLKDLPEALAQLKKLKLINIGDNEFEQLPACIGTFVNLVTLFAHSNKLKKVSHELSPLSHLQILDLDNNQLQEFPEQLPHNIEYLELQRNQITEVPSSISQLNRLKELNVAGNPLAEIPFKEILGIKSLVAVKFEKDRFFLIKK